MDDVAFRAADGLLETTRACLLAVVPGPLEEPGLVTPPCDGRVLPGDDAPGARRPRAGAGLVGPPRRPRRRGAGARPRASLACNALRGAQWVAEVGPHRWAAPSPALVELAEALLHRWRLPAG